MDIYALFNRPLDGQTGAVAATKAGPVPAGAGAGGKAQPATPVGTFITVQTLVTFPGATAVITLIWGIVNGLFHLTGPYRNLVGLLICVIVGGIIYWINTTDPNAPATPRDKQIGAVIAVLNTLVLYSASFGVTSMSGSGG